MRCGCDPWSQPRMGGEGDSPFPGPLGHVQAFRCGGATFRPDPKRRRARRNPVILARRMTSRSCHAHSFRSCPTNGITMFCRAMRSANLPPDQEVCSVGWGRVCSWKELGKRRCHTPVSRILSPSPRRGCATISLSTHGAEPCGQGATNTRSHGPPTEAGGPPDRLPVSPVLSCSARGLPCLPGCP